MDKVRQFLHKNLVMVVAIPSLIGLHMGWTWIQNQDMFVPKEQRKDLPLIIVRISTSGGPLKSYFFMCPVPMCDVEIPRCSAYVN